MLKLKPVSLLSQPAFSLAVKPQYKKRKGESISRQTKKWKTLRAKKLMAQPYCRICIDQGRIGMQSALGYAVDHIKPHRGRADLFYKWENLQVLCKKHHAQKSAQERIW